jgi:hypothetical protein
MCCTLVTAYKIAHALQGQQNSGRDMLTNLHCSAYIAAQVRENAAMSPVQASLKVLAVDSSSVAKAAAAQGEGYFKVKTSGMYPGRREEPQVCVGLYVSLNGCSFWLRSPISPQCSLVICDALMCVCVCFVTVGDWTCSSNGIC